MNLKVNFWKSFYRYILKNNNLIENRICPSAKKNTAYTAGDQTVMKQTTGVLTISIFKFILESKHMVGYCKGRITGSMTQTTFLKYKLSIMLY